jgi:hypothetical protein
LTTNATAPNGGSWANLDAFEAAKSVAEQHNATVDTFACAPATALALSTLKEYGTAGSNVPLLQSDPSAPASRTISGVPLLVSPAVAVDVVWALPRAHHHGAAVGYDGHHRRLGVLHFRPDRGARHRACVVGIHRSSGNHEDH